MSETPRKTAKERAQDAVDLAQRKVDSITKRKAAAEAQVETLTSDLTAQQALLDFAKSHPALTQPSADPKAAVAEPEIPVDPREANGTAEEKPAKAQHDLF
jgi:hypothetical protein